MADGDWLTCASLPLRAAGIRSCSPLQCHRQSAAWPQRNQRIRLDYMSRDRAQLVALRHGGEHKLRLHQGEGVADALARAAAKGQVGEVRPTGRALWRETLRLERVGILPEGGVAMHRVGAKEDRRSGWGA